ncbi:MAG: hypothetical protein R3C69_04185 [Geminicoccaceae bacterium]
MIRWLLPLLAFCALAALPALVSDYGLGLLIGAATYVTLASAWALFSGHTRYISLATVAFYGTGAYTVAVLNEALPYPLVLVAAALIGAALALVVGLSTLRLAGVYFVIFTFGLAELIRQLITWYEVNVTGTLGRYIFLDVTARGIYWQMLALGALTIGLTAWVQRARLGLALRVIGDDETVAAHSGVDLARTKLLAFTLSAVILTLAGAIVSPRWVYVEPSIVFNPTVSFLTVIMALLGGASRLWGPALGAVPLFLVFEWLASSFPDTYPIFLGLVFIATVSRCRKACWLASSVFDPVMAGGDSESSRSGGATMVFGGLRAVDEVTFALEPGEIAGLIGPTARARPHRLNLISGALVLDRRSDRARRRPALLAGAWTASPGWVWPARSSSSARCRP